jgi:F0F1-type ATP synthase assembly protein I
MMADSDPESLRARIRQRQSPVRAASHAGKAHGQYHHVLRYITEMAAALLVGGGLGYQLDVWLHTSPLFLIVCSMLGATAGFVTLLRIHRSTATDEQTESEKTASDDQERLDK